MVWEQLKATPYQDNGEWRVNIHYDRLLKRPVHRGRPSRPIRFLRNLSMPQDAARTVFPSKKPNGSPFKS